MKKKKKILETEAKQRIKDYYNKYCMICGEEINKNKDYFENTDAYVTLVSHPRVVGTATLTPIPNTTVYLLVFQGRITGLTSADQVGVGTEPLGHEDLIAQRNIDRRGALCPSDVDRECVTCPGLSETGFICNGRGDCIDGVCHCPDGNTTDYCLEAAVHLALPSSFIFLFIISTICLGSGLPKEYFNSVWTYNESYTGENDPVGPSKWYEKWDTCTFEGAETHQSPIDIHRDDVVVDTVHELCVSQLHNRYVRLLNHQQHRQVLHRALHRFVCQFLDKLLFLKLHRGLFRDRHQRFHRLLYLLLVPVSHQSCRLLLKHNLHLS